MHQKYSFLQFVTNHEHTLHSLYTCRSIQIQVAHISTLINDDSFSNTSNRTHYMYAMAVNDTMH